MVRVGSLWSGRRAHTCSRISHHGVPLFRFPGHQDCYGLLSNLIVITMHDLGLLPQHDGTKFGTKAESSGEKGEEKEKYLMQIDYPCVSVSNRTTNGNGR